MNPSFYDQLTENEKQEILDNYPVIQTIHNLRTQYIESCKLLLNDSGFSLDENNILFQDLTGYFNEEDELFHSYLADYSNMIS
jgi:hypothetical protein